MPIDAKVLADARAAFPADGSAITLGAVVHGGECDPEPLVPLPLMGPPPRRRRT